LIFAFPRLQKVNNVFIDKFTDPLIEKSNLKNNCLILQRPHAGQHKIPRLNYKKIILTDCMEFTPIIVSYLLLPFFTIIFFKKIFAIYKKANLFFSLNIKDFIIFNIKIGSFYTAYLIYYTFLKKISPKRIFVVNREINYAVIAAAKKQKIIVYELQHGVTHSWTVLYSGGYNEKIDPDYFLTFGEVWKGKQFGIPVEKIQNIGWAYKNSEVKNVYSKTYSNKILVISEPSISDNIVRATVKLAKTNPLIEFHIRLHPQEKLSKESNELITNLKNVEIQDNVIESSVALMQYQSIIGVNSSVLYEALSLNKKVGIINFEGCNTNIPNGNLSKFFTLIKSSNDLSKFIKQSSEFVERNDIYSDFNKDLFNKILL
jgi:hypothetical protein